jgi:branched-subunit amino acid transport protein
MFSFKRVTCFIVIEFFNSPYCLKGCFTVTLAAILAKLVLMGILMAVRAAGKLNIPELLEFLPAGHFHLVTFNTFNTCMFSCQGKSCPGMIKGCSRFE